jgi:anti-sigma-K factor RskA
MACGRMKKQKVPRQITRISTYNFQNLSFEQAFALDFVLGILRTPLLEQARDRVTNDGVFRDLVDRYRELLDSFVSSPGAGQEESASEMPTSDVWTAIQARLTSSANG